MNTTAARAAMALDTSRSQNAHSLISPTYWVSTPNRLNVICTIIEASSDPHFSVVQVNTRPSSDA